MELSELQMKHLHLPKDYLEGMVALQLQSSGKDWRLFFRRENLFHGGCPQPPAPSTGVGQAA